MPEDDESTAKSEPREETQAKPDKQSVLKELYIDLLGSLVPGLFTVILGFAIVLVTASTVYNLVYRQFVSITQVLISLQALLERIHYEIAVVIVVSSYVIGAIFYRQDPKRPDSLSALYVWLTAKGSDRPGLAVQDRNAKGYTDAAKPKCVNVAVWKKWIGRALPRFYIWMWGEGIDAQFPYLCMRCYLASRGLTHLLNYLPWCPEKPDTLKLRTKMFINILKIRLGASDPRFGRDIVRNEAHVRLATSVWYSAFALSRLGISCLVVLVGCLLYQNQTDVHSNCIPFVFSKCLSYVLRDFFPPIMYSPIVFISVVVALCGVMKYELRRCIHYMRVREVVYVLESAHLANSRPFVFGVSDLINKEDSGECVELCRKCEQKSASTDPTGGASRGLQSIHV